MEGIIELGSNFCRKKGSTLSSHPPSRAGVRAHPSVENFGSTSSSVFYLPACRCLRQRQDGYLGLGSNTICCPSLWIYFMCEWVICHEQQHTSWALVDTSYLSAICWFYRFRGEADNNNDKLF